VVPIFPASLFCIILFCKGINSTLVLFIFTGLGLEGLIFSKILPKTHLLIWSLTSQRSMKGRITKYIQSGSYPGMDFYLWRINLFSKTYALFSKTYALFSKTCFVFKKSVLDMILSVKHNHIFQYELVEIMLLYYVHFFKWKYGTSNLQLYIVVIIFNCIQVAHKKGPKENNVNHLKTMFVNATITQNNHAGGIVLLVL